jgi:hypothetical protein
MEAEMSARSTWLFALLVTALTWCGCKSQPETSKPEPSSPAPNETNPESESDPQPEENAPAPSGVDWSGPMTVDTGDAYAGPWRMNDSEFHYVDDPSVFVTDGGKMAVVWVDNRQQNAFFQLYGATGEALLDEPTNVSKSPEIFTWLPRVVVDRDEPDKIYVLWQEIVFSGGSHGGEAFFARSTDGGETFEQPVNLSSSIAGDGKGRLTEKRWDNGSLDIAQTPDGTILAAWTEYEGKLWVAQSSDDGASFSKPVHVTGTDRRPARGPSIAVADDGTVHLAWTVGEDDEADIHVARSEDGGRTFAEPSVAVETEGHSDGPSLVATGDALHLVWGESPTGVFGRYHVRYARASADGEFAESRALTQPVEGAAGHFPTIAAGAGDRLFVVWEHRPAGAEQSVALGWARSRDGGESFSDPALVPGTDVADLGFNGSLQGHLMRKMSVAKKRIGVVNSRFDPGESSRIRLIRGIAQ